jgi:hypothetical protein
MFKTLIKSSALALIALSSQAFAAGEVDLIQASVNPQSHGTESLLGTLRVIHQNDNSQWRTSTNRVHQVFMTFETLDDGVVERELELLAGGDEGPANYHFFDSWGGFGTNSQTMPRNIKFRYDYTRTAAESGHVNRFTTSYTLDNDGQGYSLEELQADGWTRTIVFMFGETVPGQDMFIRGGIDHGFAQGLGRDCTAENKECSLPIFPYQFSMRDNQNDFYLDWYGAESEQSSDTMGSPVAWTTNFWPSDWGPRKSVVLDGYGETSLNQWGHHYWMLDVYMDCDQAVNGWFELKSFISNGPGWEGNVSQSGTPYNSWNHFAQCGKLNKFERNSSNAEITDIPFFAQ